jgi:hypothetical protein
MANNRYKGRMSNGDRESDSCVVPMTPGNAGEGRQAAVYLKLGKHSLRTGVEIKWKQN